eukprot:845958-Amphidinium_carterae.1
MSEFLVCNVMTPLLVRLFKVSLVFCSQHEQLTIPVRKRSRRQYYSLEGLAVTGFVEMDLLA